MDPVRGSCARTRTGSTHRIRTQDPLTRSAHSRHREDFHNRAGRLRLHDLHLAEDLPLAGFGCRLITQLVVDQSLECELSGFHSFSANLREAGEDLGVAVVVLVVVVVIVVVVVRSSSTYVRTYVRTW